MGVKTVEERLGTLEKEWDVEKAVRLVMEGVTREVREAREAAAKGERATRFWIIGTILGALALCVTLMYHETDKSWNMATKAYEQPSTALARADQARSDVEAARTAKTLPQEGKLQDMAE